jgi:CheY-like chemotaxis protein
MLPDRSEQVARRRRTGSREHVLIVDDDPAVRNMTARVLGEVGFNTTAAADGVEALDVVAKRPEAFDAVLSDVVMPRLDGIGLLERLGRLRPSLPVLLMSAYTPQDLDRQGITPLCGVLTKPCRREDLVAALRECIDRRPGPPAQA